MTKAEKQARMVNRHLRMQEKLKPQYEALDKLLDRILESGMQPNQVAGDGMLRDNFARGNKSFKTATFTRFSIERVKASA